MTGGTETPVVESRPRGVRFGFDVALAVFFGLFYAYDVWEAVGNLVGLSQYAALLDSTLSSMGLILLIATILLPIGLFALAFVIGRRRSLAVRIALYVTGLAISAVLYLDAYMLFGQPGALIA
ncbi:hypothetical protein MN032_15465 [Agromyces atrinae]|uniref:hypothetical protein n=1 Tax=Agromyces atrinae TaxID=592376 RepID=UPI001F5A2143|nr:hypothetical protein [Agromyces atrinae]MCI2959092.1 hypothetical protein [Agromyces atrinae]